MERRRRSRRKEKEKCEKEKEFRVEDKTISHLKVENDDNLSQ